MTNAFAAILLAVFAQTPAEPYAWPLDLPRELTSSFGEYRPGRYHMGIDLRTGPIGKNVYVAADGHVSRLRCSPYGYGKAVYVQFDDGNSAVYAHLDDFAPALRDYVRAAQHEREQYTVDLAVPAGTFPIKRGELIAKSGQTGIGVPHLHYELRDPTGIPINPRLLGVTWPDKSPPVISTIFAVPLTPQSWVNGKAAPGRIRLKGIRGAPPMRDLYVAGPVGFAAELSDPAGRSTLGVYRVTVAIDGKELFIVQNDRVSYDHGEDGAAAFCRLFNGPALALWRDPGNDSESYNVMAGNGIFDLAAARADVTITVEDFAGNKATETVYVHKDPGPPNNTDGSGEFVYWYDGVHFDGRLLVAMAKRMSPIPTSTEPPPTLMIEGPQQTLTIPMRAFNDGSVTKYTAAWLPQKPVASVRAYISTPQIASWDERMFFLRRGAPPQRFTFGKLTIDTLPDTPYGTLGFSVEERSTDSTGELIALDSSYHLSPTDQAVDAPLVLSLPLPEGDAGKRVQFYRMKSDTWERVDTTRTADSASVTVKRLGRYALFDDTTPPMLGVLQQSMLPPAANPNPRRPVIRARVTDLGSGIDTFRATYNGKWIILAYDPEQDLLEWEQDEDLPAGSGALVVEVRDYAGNVSRQQITLTISAP